MTTSHVTARIHVNPSTSIPSGVDRVLYASDTPLHHWSVVCEPDNAPRWRVFIGVNQLDISPSWLLSPPGVLIIGVEQGVFALDFSTGDPITSIDDASYVQSVAPGPEKTILVSAEDQLFAFSRDGKLIWRTNLPDVIERMEDDQGTISIEDVSGAVYRLSPMTGKPVA